MLARKCAFHHIYMLGIDRFRASSLSRFKKFPGFISCIWIRRVDNADNSDARFNTAFADIPAEKRRIFTDADIASLASIDVAGGQC